MDRMTSKIHAVEDAHGLPIHLALTPGEAHDNRLCQICSARCFHKRCYSQIVDTTRTGSGSLPARMGEHSAKNEIAKT